MVRTNYFNRKDNSRAALAQEECPFCHKFLAPELMLRKEVGVGEILKQKDVGFKMGISVETGERIADHPEAFVAYQFTYRCKDCGKEWAKFSVKEVGLPEEDLEDEEEKTEYDADKEEEETIEEETE
jgi:hypothetical protein